MDFSFTPYQEELRETTIEFARAHLNEGSLQREKAEEFYTDGWQKCADFGILGLNLPEEYGGQAHDCLTTVCVLEALGYGCQDSGLLSSLNSQIWSTQVAILAFGSEEQKQRYLSAMCAGESIGAFAITESETGSDSYSMTATARREGDGYFLKGEKSYVTNAPIADFALVFASTRPDAGKWGISAFIVDRDTEGFELTKQRSKMGLKTSPFGEVFMDDCFVPESSRLGPEGAGFSIFATAMEAERGFIFSSQVGTMQRQLEESLTFAQGRQQFGKPISQFQSVSNRIVDMKVRLETCRMLLYRLAWMDQRGDRLAMDAAITKLHLSESFVSSSLDAIRLTGAQGYIQELGVERDLRDAVGGLIYSGTSDIQRNLIARLLGC